MFAGCAAAATRLASSSALAGIGVAFYQWWNSDKVAMRAMRAREVSPEEAPELHGMIDRLCALADMPKPRVGDRRHRHAQRLRHRPLAGPRRGLRDHRHPGQADRRGAGGRARPRAVPRRPPRRAGDDRRLVARASWPACSRRAAQYGALFGAAATTTAARRLSSWRLLVSLVVYAVSFFLLRLLSRYRELCADRAGAYLTMKPAALASALQKITGEIAAIPQRTCAPARP